LLAQANGGGGWSEAPFCFVFCVWGHSYFIFDLYYIKQLIQMKNKSAVVWWQKNNTKSVTAKNEGNTAVMPVAPVLQPGRAL
jgi:hypothetical protein